MIGLAVGWLAVDWLAVDWLGDAWFANRNEKHHPILPRLSSSSSGLRPLRALEAEGMYDIESLDSSEPEGPGDC